MITSGLRCRNGGGKPAVHLLQLLNLKRFGLFFLYWMLGAYATQDLAHKRYLGWIGETVIEVPLRKRRESLRKGGGGQYPGVVGQIFRHRISASGQEASPFDLKMSYCCVISALGIFSSRCTNVKIDV